MSKKLLAGTWPDIFFGLQKSVPKMAREIRDQKKDLQNSVKRVCNFGDAQMSIPQKK